MNASVDISKTILETQRLILRPWEETDLEDFYEYARVDIVGQMAGWNPHKSIEESRNILKLFIEEKKTFALQLKENQKVIGSLGLEELSIDLEEPYHNQKGREIGYVLNRQYWGMGLMPEAVTCVIDYCFHQMGYDFLLCSHSLSNSQSQKVIEKCGFVFIKECMRTISNGNTRASRYYLKTFPKSL